MRFLSRAGAVALLASNVLGHPALSSPARGALQGRTVDLNAFKLTTESAYVNASATAESGLTNLLSRADYVDTATALVQSVAPGVEFRLVDDHYVGTNGVAHVNFRQTAHGLDIDNADFNVNVNCISIIQIAYDY